MEHEVISHIRGQIKTDDRLAVGIGDDAAVLRTKGFDTVVTVDMLTEGVDFLTGQVDPFLIGRKALAVNLSDLAAMGAVPHSAVVAVVLPYGCDELFIKEILRGITTLARQYHLTIAGGDTNAWEGKLVLSITAIGEQRGASALLRSSVCPGDRILVTGRFGGSILGRQFLFEPRIAQAIFLSQQYGVRAAMDVSDGLLLDLTRMATESRVGFLLEDAAVPIHPDAFTLAGLIQEAAEVKKSNPALFEEARSVCSQIHFPIIPDKLKSQREKIAAALLITPNLVTMKESMTWKTPLEHALGDGEDFELILAASPSIAAQIIADQPFAKEGIPITDLGQFHEKEFDFCRKTIEGAIVSITNPGGFVH